jgi:transposase
LEGVVIMGYIAGENRNQVVLFPEAIDDYITQDNPVRFIDAFVDKMDLKELGFTKATPAPTGRPGYEPKDLLKLYIYGYKNKIRSSRCLEQETHRNVEVIWLLRQLRPDFKTLSDFRKENVKSFKLVFRQFTLLCSALDLFSGELVAIDGTKIKGVNNISRNNTKPLLEEKLKEINQRIDAYLKEIEETDGRELDRPKPTAEELKKKIDSLEAKRDEYKNMLETMVQSGETQVSLTDPDSRSFPRKFGVSVGYNAQTAVDEKHHLIIEQEVTNAVTDIDQLSSMAIRSKEALGVETLKVVADAGYCNAKEIHACEEAGIEAYIPKINTSNSTKKGLYGKEQFLYEAKNNCYTCPAGKKLPYRFEGHEKRRGKERSVLYYVGESCQSCEQKHLCTERQGPRRITRCPEEDAIDRMQMRMRQHPEIMKQRKQIVEHPFGTIKFWNHQNAFLMKGLEKVRAEFSLSTLAYNIKRVIHIVGVEKMIEALA